MTDLQDLFEKLHGDREVADQAARALAHHAQQQGTTVVAVSACLLGEPIRYDGSHKRNPAATESLRLDSAVCILPVCPEILANMGCPRAPVHYAHGDGDSLVINGKGLAVDDRGQDMTSTLKLGATRADELCQLAGAKRAVLKERSPSCGVNQVHGDAGPKNGRGVFAAHLHQRHISILSEEQG